ncbi:MAG: dihydrolipoyl dehydrogenase [Enterococcus gilvus]
MTIYDLIVIGAGPGGYVAAIRAAQRGKKVIVIEKKAVGGTCLNVGCIPSKSYLQHAHWLLAAEEASHYGFVKKTGSVDFKKMVQRKDQVVHTLQGGIKHLFQANQVTYLEGEVTEIDGTTVKVDGQTVTGKDILLATGGQPFIPPIDGLDTCEYLTTDTFFSMKELPKKLAIIGGGVIAVELAFAMRPLGVEVALIEVAPDILLTEENDARSVIKKKLKSLGIDIVTQAKIKRIKANEIELSDVKITYDRLLIAAGRKPNLALAEKLGVQLDPAKRFVKVDTYYQTSVPHVYAVGDLIGGYQLAHAASAEGLKAIDAICGDPSSPVDMSNIPRCLYTDPEVASFGLSEEEARELYEVDVKKVLFSGNGKGIAAGETEGFVKIISDKKYHQILGVVLVGSHATEMIHTLLAVKVSEGTVEEIANMVFAHPTLSEVIGETANGLLGKAIHG